MKTSEIKKAICSIGILSAFFAAACGDSAGSPYSSSANYSQDDDPECKFDDDCGGGYACQRCSYDSCIYSFASPSCPDNPYYLTNGVDQQGLYHDEDDLLDSCFYDDDCAENEICDDRGICTLILAYE